MGWRQTEMKRCWITQIKY